MTEGLAWDQASQISLLLPVLWGLGPPIISFDKVSPLVPVTTSDFLSLFALSLKGLPGKARRNGWAPTSLYSVLRFTTSSLSTQDLRAFWQSPLAPACVPLTSSPHDFPFGCALGFRVGSYPGKRTKEPGHVSGQML